MNRYRRMLFIFVLLGIIVSGNAQTRWKPFALHPDVKALDLLYEIQAQDGKTMNYRIQVKRVKEGMIDVAINTTARLPEKQLGAQTLLGLWSVYGISAMAFFNPAYTILFSQMDLTVGEKMSFFGAGMAKVTGEKTVGGLKGKVVEFYQQEGEQQRLVSRSVIHPKVFIPLENIIYDGNGNVQSRITLIKGEIK